MTSRRGFLLGIGAALAAPAIVKADSLMKIAVLRQSVGVDLASGPDHTGLFWEGNIQRGWWTQTGGRFDYRYDNPEGTHGVWSQSGRNHDFHTMQRMLEILKVRPYPDAYMTPASGAKS